MCVHVAGGQPRFGGGEALRQCGIDRGTCGQVLPLTARNGQATARGGQIGVAGGAVGFIGELDETQAAAFRLFLPLRVGALARGLVFGALRRVPLLSQTRGFSLGARPLRVDPSALGIETDALGCLRAR
ncbi:MAG: hypothetical protein DMF91_20865, partial [Acidobacteria bacterium]